MTQKPSKPVLPQSGGSYSRDEKGALTRIEKPTKAPTKPKRPSKKEGS